MSLERKILCFVSFMILCSIGACRYPKEIRQIEQKKGCTGVLSFIEANWKYDEKNQIYKRTDSFFAKFTITGKYHHCLNGLTKDEVIRLLGQPNEKKLLFGYFNNTNCKNKHGHCIGTQIEFNKNNKVENIELIGWWYGSH